MSRRALVIGGGIGGLAACVALTRAGWRADVFERAPSIEGKGLGLAVAANAVLAFRGLGVEDEIVAGGEVVHGLELRNASGKLLGRVSLDGLAARLGAPNLALTRKDVIATLRAAAPKESLHPGHAFTGAREGPSSVVAAFDDGSEEEGAILVGADGIRSVVREQLHGPAPPRYAGYSSWRAVASTRPPGLPQGIGGQSWGAGCGFGYGPASRNRVVWWCTRRVPEGGTEPPEGALPGLREIFRGFHSPVPAILASAPEGEIIRADVHFRPTPPFVGRGRIALIGDASHLMTPELGQGACQALVDAVDLGRCIATSDAESAPAALRWFERISEPRATLAMQRSAQFSRYAQVESAGGRLLRDLGFRFTPNALRERSFARLLVRGAPAAG